MSTSLRSRSFLMQLGSKLRQRHFVFVSGTAVDYTIVGRELIWLNYDEVDVHDVGTGKRGKLGMPLDEAERVANNILATIQVARDEIAKAKERNQRTP